MNVFPRIDHEQRRRWAVILLSYRLQDLRIETEKLVRLSGERNLKNDEWKRLRELPERVAETTQKLHTLQRRLKASN